MYLWTLVILFAFAAFVQAQNYTCTETGAQKCLTINPQKFWIVGEIRTFAFGGDAKSPIVSELHQNGWLECEGQSLDVTDFKELRLAIGTTWGARDPKQTFLVPDLRGIFLRGWNHAGSQTNPDGSPRPPQFPDPGDQRVPPRTKADVGTGGVQGNTGDAVGSMQASAIQDHKHASTEGYANVGAGGAIGAYTVKQQPDDHLDTSGVQDIRTTPVRKSDFETRPSNAYVMYFIYVRPYDLRNLDPTTGKLKKP